MQFNPFGSTPKGFEEITDLSEAVGLSSIPAGAGGAAGFAVLSAEDQNIRWRDDGVAPTSTVGMLLVVGEPYTYQGDLSAIEFIQVTATAKLNISYYAATGGILKP